MFLFGYNSSYETIRPAHFRKRKKRMVRTAIAKREYTNSGPGDELEKVIGARDEVESIAIRDGAGTSARRTEVAEGDMICKVRNLGPLKLYE